jgi:putative (di)nucleoside polyphosphate hydrolase
MCRRVGGGEFPWQFPQGGARDGESLEAAMWREVSEELGVENPHTICRLLAAGPAVPYPFAEAWGEYVGQEQTLFLIEFSGSDAALDLDRQPEPEFDAFRWVRLSESLELMVPAKREVLRRTYAHLTDVLEDSAAT